MITAGGSPPRRVAPTNLCPCQPLPSRWVLTHLTRLIGCRSRITPVHLSPPPPRTVHNIEKDPPAEVDHQKSDILGFSFGSDCPRPLGGGTKRSTIRSNTQVWQDLCLGCGWRISILLLSLPGLQRNLYVFLFLGRMPSRNALG